MWINKEVEEYQQKWLVNYAKSKVQQVKSAVKKYLPKAVKYYNMDKSF